MLQSACEGSVCVTSSAVIAATAVIIGKLLTTIDASIDAGGSAAAVAGISLFCFPLFIFLLLAYLREVSEERIEGENRRERSLPLLPSCRSIVHISVLPC